MTKPVATRQAQLAAIHIAQKSLGMSKDDAESVKLAVTGQASAGSMTTAQRAKYLAHLSGLQKNAAQSRGETPTYDIKRPAMQRSVDDQGDYRWGKARAMWADLASLGAVDHDTDDALLAYVKRQTHMEAWRFLNTFQINGVIESLKRWHDRLHSKLDKELLDARAHE